MKLSQSRHYIVDDDGTVVTATEVWAEMERVKEIDRASFRAWEKSEAEVDRLRAEIKGYDEDLFTVNRRADAAEAKLAEKGRAFDEVLLMHLRVEVERLLRAVEAWRKAESAVECEACAVFGANLPGGGGALQPRPAEGEK